jgi:glycerate kinase
MVLIKDIKFVIIGEGVKEEDHLLETTTLTIAELAQKHDKPAIAICATD